MATLFLIFEHLLSDFIFIHERYKALYQYLDNNLLFEWACMKKGQIRSGKNNFLIFSLKCVQELRRRICKHKKTCIMYRKLFKATHYVILKQKIKRKVKCIKDYKTRLCFIQRSMLKVEKL